ncbi:tyrosine-type recombinase/integrase [Bradyrhizobium erythrophlei]|uniref:Site-specific recombinase XerD n=1 Tax=Bradyrhizobium erythrophlei TaxID=1437360 RepID=A0A1M5I7F5_9BRAD|nr:integrase arm-type DNA-binding domain-containing protein [Bradyrhizobium erythrophlei]SHG24254.1 Site-specific recombinase XerD [Bradyrhizobium erythrophlei]
MPRRIQPLTAKQLDGVRPRDLEVVELGDGLLPGLRVRISRGGRFWSLNIRNSKGERRRFDVGDNISLAEARRRAETLKQAIKQGGDPTGERRVVRQRAKDARAGIGTLGSVINAYFDGDGASLRTKGEQQARIRHVFVKYLDRPGTEITVQELQRAADAHPSASSASRAITYLKPLARWAAKRGLMQRGFSELEKPMERSFEDGGHTVLDRDTLTLVLPEFDQGHHGPAAKLMLWTAARLDEVCSATWNEFDLDTGLWTVAAGRRKDTRSRTRRKQFPAQPHLIPLPRQAVSMLVKMREGKPTGVLVFPNAHGGKLDNWDRWSKSIFKRTGTSGWTRHDLRRTCATLAADLNVAPHIISIMLGHKTPEGNHLLGIYNKGRYRKQHGESLQAVADRLEAIEKGHDNVTALVGRQSELT